MKRYGPWVLIECIEFVWHWQLNRCTISLSYNFPSIFCCCCKCLILCIDLSFAARRTTVCAALSECCVTRSIFYSCWPERNCTWIGRRRTSTNVWKWEWRWIVSKMSSRCIASHILFESSLNHKQTQTSTRWKWSFIVLGKITNDFCNNHRETPTIRVSFR